MKTAPWVLVGALIVILIISLPIWTNPTIFAQKASVVRIVDGDTIDVLFNSEIHRIRYIGVDTPEINTKAGELAKNVNTAIVGHTVFLKEDVEDTDQYGRLLRYVWNNEGEFVNCKLLEIGVAELAIYPPNVTRIPQLRMCQ